MGRMVDEGNAVLDARLNRLVAAGVGGDAFAARVRDLAGRGDLVIGDRRRALGRVIDEAIA